MTRRDFAHADNPSFECRSRVLLLPFGRQSYLPAVVDALDGIELPLDDTTDRLVFDLRGAPTPLTLAEETDRRYHGLRDPRVRRAFEAGLGVIVEVLAGPEG